MRNLGTIGRFLMLVLLCGLNPALLDAQVKQSGPAAGDRAARRVARRERLAQSRPAGQTSLLLPGVRILRDLEYARPADKPLLLDLYLPEKAAKPMPLIVWIHGGGWQAGSKNRCPGLTMTKAGYAMASIDYRLTDEAVFPAQIEDCKAAIRWLRAHARQYELDPERVGVWGASAGGHLVALLGTTGGVKELEGTEGNAQFSSRVQAVCDWFGPSSLLPAPAEQPKGLLAARRSEMIGKLLGGAGPEKLDKARQASPLTHVSKSAPPFLIMHGNRDQLVPIHQSEMLYEALKKAGVDVTLDVVKGAGHGIGFGPNEVRKVQEFFDRVLKARTPASKPAA